MFHMAIFRIPYLWNHKVPGVIMNINPTLYVILKACALACVESSFSSLAIWRLKFLFVGNKGFSVRGVGWLRGDEHIIDWRVKLEKVINIALKTENDFQSRTNCFYKCSTHFGTDEVCFIRIIGMDV